MDVHFGTRALHRQYESLKEAVKKYGPDRGRRYVQRVNALYDAEDWDAIRQFSSLRAHALRDNRAGQWAIVLQGRWRLIVEVSEDEKSVTIREVSNHYDD